MIYQALQPALTALAALDWTERIGGLATPVRIPYEADGRTLYKVYPVRQAVSADACVRENRYLDLVPDSRYKNLLYLEQRGPMQAQAQRKADEYVFAGAVRLVYWLNLPAMGRGAEAESLRGLVVPEIVAALDTASGITGKGRVRYERFTVVESNAAIFDRYSYGEEVDALLLYPYDFGAVDFVATYTFSTRCMEALELETPIECVSNW